jgi:hypothetical protein
MGITHNLSQRDIRPALDIVYRPWWTPILKENIMYSELTQFKIWLIDQ